MLTSLKNRIKMATNCFMITISRTSLCCTFLMLMSVRKLNNSPSLGPIESRWNLVQSLTLYLFKIRLLHYTAPPPNLRKGLPRGNISSFQTNLSYAFLKLLVSFLLVCTSPNSQTEKPPTFGCALPFFSDTFAITLHVCWPSPPSATKAS